jgi:asparagine synthase (glutamine-hydrolysing)
MAEWLRGDFGQRAEASVLTSPLLERGFLNRNHVAKHFRNHIEGRCDNALHLWALYNLTTWYDKWIARL